MASPPKQCISSSSSSSLCTESSSGSSTSTNQNHQQQQYDQTIITSSSSSSTIIENNPQLIINDSATIIMNANKSILQHINHDDTILTIPSSSSNTIVVASINENNNIDAAAADAASSSSTIPIELQSSSTVQLSEHQNDETQHSHHTEDEIVLMDNINDIGCSEEIVVDGTPINSLAINDNVIHTDEIVVKSVSVSSIDRLSNNSISIETKDNADNVVENRNSATIIRNAKNENNANELTIVKYPIVLDTEINKRTPTKQHSKSSSSKGSQKLTTPSKEKGKCC